MKRQHKLLRLAADPNGDTSKLAFGAYGRGPLDPDIKKKGLQVEITVEDSGVFTTRWSALVTYRPVTGDWPEVV
jgi:hypothetical protein